MCSLNTTSGLKRTVVQHRNRHSLSCPVADAGADPDVTEALGRAVVEGSDLDLIKMRPYALADEWALPRRTVLDAFLLSTRLGLLDVSWDILCPLCRGAKDTTTNLAGILPQVHCETCNIDFDVDFDRSVELTFRPGSTIREVGRTEYCVAGPRVTPHVVVQQLLQPSEKRIVSPELEEGRHRIRTLRLAGGRYLDVKDEGPSSVDVDATPSGWGREAVAIGLTPTLSLRNDTDEEQLFVLERMVVDHFGLLRSTIDRHGGGIVKTIGDAVMAAFRDPGAALRAALEIQEIF